MNAAAALLLIGVAASAQPSLRDQAEAGLRKACDFFHKEVSTQGGYLWKYSDDLKRREGEGKADATQAWVQPPGTPSVGFAFLAAYKATGDRHYLEQAMATGNALRLGQLRSGGWDYVIHFDPKARLNFAYRVEPANEKGKNSSTLDDNNSQAALRFLIALDVAMDKKDPKVREAIDYGLSQLLKVQYPNGAWPQRFSGPPDADKHPVKKANFPEKWSRTFPAADYRGFYTFNDNSIADVIDVMLFAAKTYGEEKYRKAAMKAGDFMLLAQLPEPQPGWSQQYNLDMQPAWARKFEPPSITGGESQQIMKTLLRLYRETADPKYLEPLPRALAYYKKITLPDGKLARFYEMGTDKPLYFTKKYELTYKDDDMPTHYGFKVSSNLDVIAKELEAVKKIDPKKLLTPSAPSTSKPSKGEASPALIEQVKEVLAKQDSRGAWVEMGTLKTFGPDDPTMRVIAPATFIKNVGILSSYLGNTKK